MKTLVGSLIREYRIVTELGSGGMGTVYFAEHTVIGRRAAIKVLNRDVSANEDIVARFFTEAKAVNSIRHPNIVDITDFGQADSIYFIIMEMLEGETLGARLEAVKVFDERATVRIVGQVAAAVGAVNERGIVHRDLKPENIFLTNHPDYPDFVKVLDFGVVKLMGAPVGAPHKTQPGAAIGTPVYMSPEQCIGDANLDHHSDIYSTGVVAYEMLTGQPPFTGDSLEVMMGHARGPVVPPKERNAAVSDAMNDVIMRALAKKPADRFATMRELKAALEAVVAPAAVVLAGGAAAAVPPPPAASPAPAASPGSTRAPTRRHAPGAAPAPPIAIDEERQQRIEQAQSKKVGGKLREIISRRIAQNRMTVPAMPAVALRCLDQLRDPNAKFSELASTIEKDPLIASRLLRIVNSPAYGGREPISSIENAVSRFGLKPFKMILIELSAREVFVSKNQKIREAFRGIWEHCLAVGMLARDLAAALPGSVDSDSAYLAGLFHDVGKPVVAALLLEAERSLLEELGEPFMTDTLWLKVVNDAHRDVGAALASQWNLPPAVTRAIAAFDAYDPAGGRGSCANLVKLANALTKRHGLYVGAVDESLLMDELRQGRGILDLPEETEQALTTGLRERVEAITGASASPPRPAKGPS
jgi:putative nucleotidyltransferase with HDIG domain